jgi:hypothetical protein
LWQNSCEETAVMKIFNVNSFTTQADQTDDGQL